MRVLLVSGILDQGYYRKYGADPYRKGDASGFTHVHTRTAGPYILKDSLIKEGISCDVLDFFSFWNPKDLQRWCLKSKQKYDFIGFTGTFSHAQPINETVSYFKKYWPDAITIVGCMNSLQNINADYMVYGFGEKAIVKIINHEFFQEDLKFNKINNTKYIDAYKDYLTIKDDYTYKLFEEDGWHSKEPVFLEINRGCRFKCKFCSFPLLGIKEDTSGSEQSFYDFLKRNYEEFGKKNYLLCDDTANNRTSSLVKLRNAVNKLDFQPMFVGFVRPDLVIRFPEQRELMAEMGFIGHQYGIETFKHSTAKRIGKGVHPDIIKEYLVENYEYYSKHNLKTFFSSITMMAGLPGESIEEMRESNRWIKETFKDNKNFSCWWFPLTLEDISLKETTGSISDFSVNADKYGYKLLDTKVNFEGKVNKFSGLNWENEFTNLSEVYRLTAEFNSDTPDGSDLWKVPYWYRYTNKRNLNNSYIKDYIDLKLSRI